MSPITSPVFEALPVEVLANILRHMASPEDVYSTIRAIPKALRSFDCFREAILFDVIQAHLPAEIFAEYLGLLHTPQYENFNYVPEKDDFEAWTTEPADSTRDAWECCRYQAWHTVFEAFFETHLANVRVARSSEVQRYSVPQPADKHQINYIISMYGTLKRFTRDYQSFVRSIMTGSPPPLSDLEPCFRRQEALVPQVWPPLNENEAIRLQRGFLRYELYSRLKAIPTWKCDPILREYLYIWESSICQHLQPWEEEEIMCAWIYVHRQYQVLVREVLAEYRCDVRRLSRKARHAPDNEVTLAPEINTKFHDKSFLQWTYNMSCLGLPMLQQLLRSEFDDQRRFLKRTTFRQMPPCRDVLYLRDSHHMYQGDGWDNQSPVENPRTTNSASPIYKSISTKLADWATGGVEDIKELDAAEVALKEIGWAFWEDIRRFKYLGWPASDTSGAGKAESYLKRLAALHPPRMFEVEDKFPEQSMYVTKEDVRRELSPKYAVGPCPRRAQNLFIDRLREISDWSSKEASPAFLEICRGRPFKGSAGVLRRAD